MFETIDNSGAARRRTTTRCIWQHSPSVSWRLMAGWRAALHCVRVPALVILFVVAAGQSPWAATDVSKGLKDGGVTPHNLSVVEGQVCSVCHVPQRDGEVIETRWVSADSAAAFALYGGPTTSERWTTSPEGVTLVCLSCHDGVTAPDRLNSVERTADAGSPRLGPVVSLFDEHPVSTGYSLTSSVNFKPASLNGVAGLPLFGPASDRVECATCHDPHAAPPGPLLRDPGGPDSLCTTCHIK